MRLTRHSVAAGFAVVAWIAVACSRPHELTGQGSSSVSHDTDRVLEAGPERLSGPATETPPKACVAECPASSPACTHGLTTGVGSPACNATESLLYQHSPGCLACALNAGCLHDNQGEAPPKVSDCEDVKGKDKIDAATTRKQACLGLLDCELTSKCGAANVLDCYCGAGVNSRTCETTRSGACTRQVELGLETDDPVATLRTFTAVAGGTGGAVANAILLCLRNNCQRGCF